MHTRAALTTSPSKQFALATLFALCIAALPLFAQTPAQREAPATVTGRVTDGEKGIAGISVGLTSIATPSRSRSVARAKTDGEGRYRMPNVPPGRYVVAPFAPAYIVQDMNEWPPGKPLTLAAGEEVADIDFRLERGGVITGRVTDADGNSIIAHQVTISPADNEQRFQQRRGPIDPRDISTDDRGVYRLYGLQPGRYLVSVGLDEANGGFSYGARKLYRRTFYPDATEQAQARIVEVTAGGEATNVDITLGRALKTYRASGRFVSAETGEPVPNVSFGYGALDRTGRRTTSFGGGAQTNARGEFQTEGLAPGRYNAFAYPMDNLDWYSDAAPFEITDADVTGVVVKLRRGASASGVVVVEGVSDRATATRLVGGVRLFGFTETRGETMVPNYARPITVGADGRFRFTGLRPGKLRINADGDVKGLALARVELSGANMRDGIDITSGAQVAGIRVVLTYGNGVIRGQLNVTNGTVAPGARLVAHARRIAGGDDQNWRSSQVDARGRFIIEGLAAGEYDVHVQGFAPGTRQRYQSEHQTASIAEGGDVNVTLALDLGAPANKEGRQ